MEIQKHHRRWLLVAACFIFVGFGGVVAQLFELQVVRHQELAGKARRYIERTYVKASRRADIRDVRGTMLATSKPGDVVLDPFAGTGTSGAVAQKLDRRWVMIEREPAYRGLIEQRIASLAAKR